MKILVNKKKLWNLKLVKYIETEEKNGGITLNFNLNKLIDEFLEKEQPITKISIGGILWKKLFF